MSPLERLRASLHDLRVRSVELEDCLHVTRHGLLPVTLWLGKQRHGSKTYTAIQFEPQAYAADLDVTTGGVHTNGPVKIELHGSWERAEIVKALRWLADVIDQFGRI